MPNTRILIVEDNEKLCRVLEVVLPKHDLDARFAGDWRQALTMLEKEKFDAVVLDIMLPGMSGYEILESLRRGEHAKLPVVVCSALGAEEDRERAKKAGADAILPKPYSPAALAKLIGRVLKRRSM